jgi:hypothetical protein
MYGDFFEGQSGCGNVALQKSLQFTQPTRPFVFQVQAMLSKRFSSKRRSGEAVGGMAMFYPSLTCCLSLAKVPPLKVLASFEAKKQQNQMILYQFHLALVRRRLLALRENKLFFAKWMRSFNMDPILWA